MTTPLHHRVDGFRVTFERGLHSPVRQIADEASNSPRGRLVPAIPTEVHALDFSRHEHVDTLRHREIYTA